MGVVDEFLGEIHQLGGRGEGVADGECVFEGEKPLIKAKTDKPADLVLHGVFRDRMDGECGCVSGVAKRQYATIA